MPKNPNVTVMIPKRSAFDWSHHNLLSQTCGTIVPIFSQEVIPGTKINQKIALSVSMPPLVSDTYMRCSYKVCAFFVPYRLLFGGYQNWFNQYTGPSVAGGSSGNQIDTPSPYLPYLNLTGTSTSTAKWLGPGTLFDYLGGKATSSTSTHYFECNIFPFLAYHKIYEDFFRASQVQKPCFAPPRYNVDWPDSHSYNVAMLPYLNSPRGGAVMYGWLDETTSDKMNQLKLADGVNLLSLRQANFGFDYFTNAWPAATQPSMSVSSASSFTIEALRSANSLQQFSERLQLSGYKFADNITARYGANLKDYVASKSVFLGSADYEVYSKGVNLTNVTPTSTTSAATKNPYFESPAARYGNAFGSGSDFLIKGFEVNEPGIIMVTGVFMPRVTYGSGLRKYLRRYTSGTSGSIMDMANPQVQNVGNEPIFAYELHTGSVWSTPGSIFGYSDRFASWMTMEDELHSSFSSGGSLQYFALQRTFASTPTLNSAFLEIPKSYMDDVTTYVSTANPWECWVDIDFDCKVLMPLYRYSMPSLQDPAYEHGRPVSVRRGGFRF